MFRPVLLKCSSPLQIEYGRWDRMKVYGSHCLPAGYVVTDFYFDHKPLPGGLEDFILYRLFFCTPKTGYMAWWNPLQLSRFRSFTGNPNCWLDLRGINEWGIEFSSSDWNVKIEDFMPELVIFERLNTSLQALAW